MDVQTTGRLLIFSLFKRQKMILQIILTILATIVLGSLLLPPSYEAYTTLLVRGRTNQDLLTPSARVDNSRTVMLNPLDEINSEIEIIKSRPVMEAVVRTLKLYDRPPTLETGFFGSIRNLIRLILRLPKMVLHHYRPDHPSPRVRSHRIGSPKITKTTPSRTSP